MAQHPFPWQEVFLAALAQRPVLTFAAEAAGIDRTTAWRRMQSDKAFAEAVELAMESGVDRAEAEAFRRAVDGFEEPIVANGRLVYRHQRVVAEDGTESYEPLLDAKGQPIPLTIRKHSDGLLTTILTGRRKQIYARRTEITNPDGSMAHDETARAARIAAILETARRRREAEDFS